MTEKTISLVVGQGWTAAETALVAAARQDPAAFGKLYDHYVQPLYRYILSRTGSVPEAEDITAQTFLAALEALDRYRHQGYFSAWLFSIAHNKMVAYFRKQHRQVPLDSIDQLPAVADLLQQVSAGERSAALQQIIRGLPANDRELLRLRYVAELSFAEMAAFLGRSEPATKKALYRLLGRLQSRLEESHA